MRIVYVDTSALGRVLLNEPDRPAIQQALNEFDEALSSRLLWVELGRLARRRDAEFAAKGNASEFVVLAKELLRGVAAIPLEDELLGEDEDILGKAEAVAPFSVATLDAIHLMTAVYMAQDLPLTLMTYDHRLAEGAREHGLAVLSPR